MPEDDDERHKREEAERRAKRKANKNARSAAQLEKSRKQKEHRQKILQKHGGAASKSGDKRKKPGDPKEPTSSAFQELFAKRAQGFQIDFRFRNAPPRPPVGPCFVGNSLDMVLNDLSRQYKPHNAVEVNHTWKLHSEQDVGVPLAPSAMDLKSFKEPDEDAVVKLHPDDAALLDWKGSMGDTAADRRKRQLEQSRAAARMAATGRSPPSKPNMPKKLPKKNFSRVLREDMQTWMKKTTYLSNDYSRKVHDFKSLAQTKSELAADLSIKHKEMAARRSAEAIKESFESTKPLKHPTRKGLQPKHVMHVFPDVANWGRAFTHVVIDKAPVHLPEGFSVEGFSRSFVTNVQKQQANAKMTCDVQMPTKDDDDMYRAAQSYELDVVPLKEEDSPHMHFCLSIAEDKKTATYIPLASRVQLSTGRPAKSNSLRKVEHRPLSDREQEEMEERMAEVDHDLAEKHHITEHPAKKRRTNGGDGRLAGEKKADSDDDGEDDFGDSDSEEEEEVFGAGAKTIVAES